MINAILVFISIILSIILVILLLYIRHLKRDNIVDDEREPLIDKYNSVSISEDFFSRIVSKIPRIQKTREITNNFNSGEQIEDTFSILNKIDKEELLIANQLSQYCQSFNEQRRIDTGLSNGNINKASINLYTELNRHEPIDLDQIQSNILSKSYSKSVPNNNTLDILKFKLYHQELEKKKKDKSVYINLLNQYNSTTDNGNLGQYIVSDSSKYEILSNPSYSVSIDEEKDENQNIHNQEILNDKRAPSSLMYSNKPPLYLSSIRHNPNNKNEYNNNNEIHINTTLTKDSSIINNSNKINKENYNTPVNDSNSNYNDTYHNHIVDNESLKSPISNDNYEITSLSSPSGILSSPQATKLFNDISSLSIIIPKTVDDSIMFDNNQEQILNQKHQHQLYHSFDHSFDLDNKSPITPITPLNPLTALPQFNEGDNNNSNATQPNQSFIDLSINNNISNVIEETEMYENDDYSINYNHNHSMISNRRRSSDYFNKRRSKSLNTSSYISKNIVPSSLFASSLPPIDRPKRVQSLKRKLSDVLEKKTMAKAQDYIALSQRSFPVRANFVPDDKYDDEIQLNIGDLVIIKDVYLDSWANGINIMTNSSGVFPLCYLNTDEPQAKAKTKRFNKIVNDN
ncbi:hypothetical protein BCR36DRAFT_405540 [Piromyces finnis]|uniref:SH3 domain-containing protein n=1 Tax=Piromyces finnis TaxID=1754191 RepID=A0A1Y1V4K9_9FUNG|nr:hypothetical protein BCR36DRAFT_405540 [Piromyces finnis]|eukprot:ORX46940.1 hypothetical protein BCR36DRAFT_405540 [Piromyces finnis]